MHILVRLKFKCFDKVYKNTETIVSIQQNSHFFTNSIIIINISAEQTDVGGDRIIYGTSTSVKLVSKKTDEQQSQLTNLTEEMSSLDKSYLFLVYLGIEINCLCIKISYCVLIFMLLSL